MKLVNKKAEIAISVLSQRCRHVVPFEPWHWQCIVQNGTRLPMTARFADGFLRVESRHEEPENHERILQHGARWNTGLAGGVKIAIDPSTGAPSLCADILVVEEEQLARWLDGVFEGFHAGNSQIGVEDGTLLPCPEDPPLPAAQELVESLQWPLAPSESGEYAVSLDANGARPARVRFAAAMTSVIVEIARLDASEVLSARALDLYLLAATGAMRFVKACHTDSGDQAVFSLAASLPAAPLREELEHALASLSIAHRLCSREANLLLDQFVAGRYLAVLQPSIRNSTNHT